MRDERLKVNSTTRILPQLLEQDVIWVSTTGVGRKKTQNISEVMEPDS